MVTDALCARGLRWSGERPVIRNSGAEWIPTRAINCDCAAIVRRPGVYGGLPDPLVVSNKRTTGTRKALLHGTDIKILQNCSGIEDSENIRRDTGWAVSPTWACRMRRCRVRQD